MQMIRFGGESFEKVTAAKEGCTLITLHDTPESI